MNNRDTEERAEKAYYASQLKGQMGASSSGLASMTNEYDSMIGDVGNSQTKAMPPSRYRDPREWAHDICSYHSPSTAALEKIGAIRAATENLINEILRSCPEGNDKDWAINTARATMMVANASIALNGKL